MDFANRFDGYRMFFRKIFRTKNLKEKDRLILKEVVAFVRENYVEIKPKENVKKFSAVSIDDEKEKLADARKYIKELAVVEDTIGETFAQAVQEMAKDKF
ncbi:MAG: hypothetical protein IKW25_03955, partial [Phascolarctobacterium sp.]|nr:hypothetical protein [Phascolarctobacterium sp.]